MKIKEENFEEIINKKITKLLNKYSLEDMGEEKLVKMIVKKFRDIKIDGNTILHMVAKNKNNTRKDFFYNKYLLLRTIIENIDIKINYKNNEGKTFLYYLLDDDNYHVLSNLLMEYEKFEIDLYTFDSWNESLLHNILYNCDNNEHAAEMLNEILDKTMPTNYFDNPKCYQVKRWKEYIDAKDVGGKSIVDLIIEKIDNSAVNSRDYKLLNYCLIKIFKRHFELFSNMLTDDKKHNIELIKKYFLDNYQNPLYFTSEIEDEVKCERVVRKIIDCNIFENGDDIMANDISFVYHYFGNKSYRFIYRILELALSRGCKTNFDSKLIDFDIFLKVLSECDDYDYLVDLYVLLSKYDYEIHSAYSTYDFSRIQSSFKKCNSNFLDHYSFDDVRFDALKKILDEIAKENDFVVGDKLCEIVIKNNILPLEFIEITNIFLDIYGITSDYELMNILMSRLIQQRDNSINNINVITQKDIYCLLHDMLNECTEKRFLTNEQKDSVNYFTEKVKKLII